MMQVNRTTSSIDALLRSRGQATAAAAPRGKKPLPMTVENSMNQVVTSLQRILHQRVAGETRGPAPKTAMDLAVLAAMGNA